MTDRKNTPGETFVLYALAFAVFAICALLMAASDGPAPAAAALAATEAAAGEVGYLPAQHVHQAREIDWVQDYTY